MRDVSGPARTQDVVPVLEVGGTHVAACTVDPRTWTIVGARARRSLDSAGAADDIVATFASVCAALDVRPGAVYAVAMPDPFDYVRGIGLFAGVGKFDALNGVNIRSALLRLLPRHAADVVFCNDADAFALGEWVNGAASGADGCVGLTLGTGVGSGWVREGRIVDPGVPLSGRAHHLMVDGAVLEETMSRRAIRRAYASLTGDSLADVREIAERAAFGEEMAREVLVHALRSLGAAIAPAIRGFGADVVVMGGSMTGSWTLFEPWFLEGCGPDPMPPVVVAADAERAPMVGAAFHAAG